MMSAVNRNMLAGLLLGGLDIIDEIGFNSILIQEY
jgi:hypothetical protein